MNNNTYLLILVSLLYSSFSFSQEETIDLKRGDTIHKKIILQFNETAIGGQESLTFKINDDFDFDNLTLLINDKETKGKTFEIRATQRKDTLINIPISIVPKKNASSGDYYFSLKIVGSSNALKGNIEYKKRKEFKRFTYSISKSTGEIVLTVILVLLVLILGTWIFLILLRKSRKFKKGSIHIIEPSSQNYNLRGKIEFNSSKEGCFTETGIYFIIKKGKHGTIRIRKLSENTTLYINDKLKTKSELIGKNHVVKLKKDDIVIIFKFI